MQLFYYGVWDSIISFEILKIK